MPTESLDDTARQILDAASKRFLHYGYGKTTMSEIAADCNMSTGNLYRYFPSKLDIAETFVGRLRREHIAAMRKAASGKDLTPQERLRRLLQTKFRLTFERFHDRPKAFELSSEVRRDKPEVAVEWEQAEAQLIREVLEEGEAAGVFAPGERQKAPKLIQDAVYRFASPSVFYEGDFDHLVAEMNELIDFILSALEMRARQHAS